MFINTWVPPFQSLYWALDPFYNQKLSLVPLKNSHLIQVRIQDSSSRDTSPTHFLKFSEKLMTFLYTKKTWSVRGGGGGALEAPLSWIHHCHGLPLCFMAKALKKKVGTERKQQNLADMRYLSFKFLASLIIKYKS